MDILKELQDYKGMISAYCKDQLTTPSSEYGGLKDYVESFSIQLKNTIDIGESGNCHFSHSFKSSLA